MDTNKYEQYVCILGYNNMDVFLEKEKARVKIVDKTKSKTCLYKTILCFLRHFHCVWLQSLQKVLIRPKKYFFLQKMNKCVQRRIILC